MHTSISYLSWYFLDLLTIAEVNQLSIHKGNTLTRTSRLCTDRIDAVLDEDALDPGQDEGGGEGGGVRGHRPPHPRQGGEEQALARHHVLELVVFLNQINSPFKWACKELICRNSNANQLY